MLKKIRIKNFKPFSDSQAVRLAPITLIYGPNSSGKSSLIQSLLLIRQTLTARRPGTSNDLITRGEFTDLGGFSSLLHRHDTRRELRFEYEFEGFPADPIYHYNSRMSKFNQFYGVSLSFQSMRSPSGNDMPGLKSVSYKLKTSHEKNFNFTVERPELNNEILSGVITEDEESISSSEGRKTEIFRFCEDSSLDDLAQFLSNNGDAIVQRSPFFPGRLSKRDSKKFNDVFWVKEQLRDLEITRDPRQPIGMGFLPTTTTLEKARRETARNEPVSQVVSEILRTYDVLMRRTLGRLTYLGPLRTHPARHYLMDNVPGDSVGSKGEQTVQILFHDQTSGSRGQGLLERLNQYCSQFEIPYKFRVKKIGDEITGDFIVLSLTDARTGVRVGPADVGFGIGQLLPILVEGILANDKASFWKSRIICVEQPEIHLHPRLQAALADFFIDTSAIRNDQSGVQWILETHSEALILRLQRRIREKFISPDNVSVLYVDPRGDKGAVIEELRLDENGDFIDLWPDGFFIEGFKEIMGSV